MIKKYKLFLESNNDIDAICKKFGIKNYTINPDGSVDVNGDVNLSYRELTKLPLKFGRVGGYFSCSDNQLTSLEGAPREVGGDFYCSYNQLTSLEGAPSHVGGHFYCYYNQLTSLEGAPKYVGGDFFCHRNQLVDFRGFPEFFENGISLSDNPIEEIYNLFGDIKCIYWLNEFDVIDGNKVIEDRLIEVYSQLGKKPPKTIKLKNYILI